MDWQEYYPVVIATLLSPLFLKVVEFIFSRASYNTRETARKLEALGKKVDDLRTSNQELAIKSAMQDSKIKEQQQEIIALRRSIAERDTRIHELESEVHQLRMETRPPRRRDN